MVRASTMVTKHSICEVTFGLSMSMIYVLVCLTFSQAHQYIRDGQSLDNFPIDIPGNTTSIDLSKNDISDLPIIGDIAPALMILDLYSNAIETVTAEQLGGLNQLRELLLGRNRITTFPVLSPLVPNLEKCTLRNNDITHIIRAQFSRLSKLVTLKLQKNPLVVVELPTDVPLLNKLYLDNITNVLTASHHVADDGTLLFHEKGSVACNAYCWILKDFSTDKLQYRSCTTSEMQTYSSQLTCVDGKMYIIHLSHVFSF